MDLNFFDKMALSTFTSIEKQSLYQLLCGAMIIDGNRDAREIAVINEVKQIMGISFSDCQSQYKFLLFK